MATRDSDMEGGLVGPRSTALIVIDVQRGFVNGHSRGVIPAIVNVVKQWHSAGAPIVFARFLNAPGSPYETITGWTKLRTAEERELIPELSAYVDDAAGVIDKPQSSIFTAEGTRLLQGGGWTDLVMCGIDTDSCVYDSAIAAYHAGFRPWVVTDACASTGGPEYHDAAIMLAARNIGSSQLVTTHDVLTHIGNPPGGPR
ncbi:isochorismatase family cysteine hydrolase [Streptomyces sp. NPDC059718]